MTIIQPNKEQKNNRTYLKTFVRTDERTNARTKFKIYLNIIINMRFYEDQIHIFISKKNRTISDHFSTLVRTKT